MDFAKATNKDWDTTKSKSRERDREWNKLCQKCMGRDHWTYECKGNTVYKSRPSATQRLKNPPKPVQVSEAKDASKASKK